MRGHGHGNFAQRDKVLRQVIHGKVQDFTGEGPGRIGIEIEGGAETEIAYFSSSWTPFQADRGRDFSVIVDGVSV